MKMNFLFIKNSKFFENNINNIDLNNINKYKIILVIRNPYHRLVSGFYGKYARKNAPFKNPDNCSCFVDFVKILYNNPELIDKNHFEPQCKGEIFNRLLKSSNNINIIDINNINIIAKILNVNYKILNIKFSKKIHFRKKNQPTCSIIKN